MFSNLQVEAPVRRRKDPSPSRPSRRCRFSSSKPYRLDVRGRRITGYPTSVDRRDVRAAARSPDQGRSSLVLFIVVVDDPHQPTTLGAWLDEPWPIEGSAAVPAGIASVGDGSTAIGLFPATLSSMVSAGRF